MHSILLRTADGIESIEKVPSLNIRSYYMPIRDNVFDHVFSQDSFNPYTSVSPRVREYVHNGEVKNGMRVFVEWTKEPKTGKISKRSVEDLEDTFGNR